MKVAIAVVLVFIVALTEGCAGTKLLGTESAKVIHNVASPYLITGCKEVTIAPVYSMDAAYGQPHHTGGVLVGGCGKLAELKCGQIKDSDVPSCEALSEWEKKGEQSINAD